MPVKTRRKENSAKTKGPLPNDVPQFFRLNIEVGDLKSAISFYTKLLGIEGRGQAGSRCYFECGPVTLQVSTSRRKVSRTPPLRRFTSQSKIWRRYMSEPRP